MTQPIFLWSFRFISSINYRSITFCNVERCPINHQSVSTSDTIYAHCSQLRNFTIFLPSWMSPCCLYRDYPRLCAGACHGSAPSLWGRGAGSSCLKKGVPFCTGKNGDGDDLKPHKPFHAISCHFMPFHAISPIFF